MKTLLRKLTAVVSAAAVVTVGGIIGLSALAVGDGVQTTLDIGRGNIVISADSVSGCDSSGNTVKEIDPDGYIITGSTTSNTVTVSGTQNITLQNATIDLSDGRFCAFDIGNGGNVTLTLEGVNTIKSGKSCAGIDVIAGETLEITGTGSLTVTGGQYGAGIGTGMNSDGDHSSCGSVVISGGSVCATGGENGATVGDGAWYYSSEGEAPCYINGDFCPPKDKNDNGNDLYPCTINNPNSETVYIDGVEFLPKIHSDSEKAVHAYLTKDTHYIRVGDKLYAATPDNSGSFDVNVVTVGSAFSITATSGELVYGKDYTYPADTGVLTILSDKAVTISGTTTTDTIVVASGVSANITLDGVDIVVSGTPDTCAFKIADNSVGNVTITLADGSVNTLKSGSGCAGLQKNGANGTLEIKGTTGTLTATSGDYGAGIGGGNNASASNITISGGTVTAVGLYCDGAGIGGGYNGDGSYITISGGSVTAQSSGDGAGIGGGNHGNGSYITISGGSVTAQSSGDGASIGGGDGGSGSNITISGGSVEAQSLGSGAGIGGGYDNSGSNITISGGSVMARSEKGDVIGGGKGGSAYNIIISGGSVDANRNEGRRFTETPTNGNGKSVYLLTIYGTSLTVDDVEYTTNFGIFYVYLTEGEHTVIANGKTTTYNYKANARNELEAVGTDLTITADSGELVYGEDYTYPADTSVLTILSDKAVTISGTTNTDIIFVAKDVLANITLNGVSIDVSSISDTAAFKIADDSTGNVTITLADGSENTLISGSGCAGLQKNGAYISADKGKLTITGNTGKLTAVGGKYGAGIGGGSQYSGSNITISGGTVIANGGYKCAGIGGGYNSKGSYITISGGKVTATGGYEGAGIGGGSSGGDSSGGSNITISGGKVTATGGYEGAGIGGGYYNSGSYITISGGTVTATGGKYGAGIGGGYQYSGSNITISGGVVTTTGGEKGAGIGGGDNGSGSYIAISDGTVTATGGKYGAGIGGGNSGGGSNVTISGGSVKAVAGENAKDIGGGYNNGIAVTPTNGTSNVYLLTIANPTGAAVTIDNVQYAVANHSAADANDTNLYAYLTGEAHTVTVGEVTTEYKFYGGKFLPVPTVSDFTFTAPDNLKYTGTAKTATVTSDKAGMGEITVKYFNASGVEVTQDADFVPGTYTVKIDVAKGENYAAETFTKDDWKFTITAGDLTASGAGKASGTFGDKLSELSVSGLTAKLGETEIEGTWALSGSDVPNVGDTKKYTATFTPSANAEWYNELTAEVSLDIAKANAPTIEDIPLSYTWAITGEKTATVSGLPDNMGTIGAAVIEVTDTNSIIKENSAVYGQGRIRFTLNGFDSEKKDISATIKVTLPSKNYKDTTFSVIVNITEKQDKEAPAESDFELSIDLQSDNTYKATIKTALTGVEYSFDGTTWSSTNTTAVSHGTTVTGYIRYAETLEYKASEAVSKSAKSAHGTLKYHDPKAATCTEDGNIEYWTCDSCVKYFTDKNGTAEITAEQIVVTKLGHEWAEKYNFDKDGHWHNCERCGEATESEAHISGGEATAENAEVCTTCGYEIAPKTGQTAAPLFSSNGGTFGSIQKVSITSATEGATIYYTTDGSEPTTDSTKYTAVITIDKTTTIKAIAVKDDMENSKVVTAEFTIILPVTAPVISPNGGSFTGSQTVKITCATEGAKIYYTTDGTAPKTSSTFYEKEFTITENTTVRAIAVKEGMTNSAIVSVSFTKRSSSDGGGGSSGGGSSGGGSSGGGSSGGGSTSSTPTTINPSIGGSAKSWSDVAADLGKLTNGSEATIELNGSTSVPVEVIKAIATSNAEVTLKVDDVFSWTIDGSEMDAKDANSANLSIIKTTVVADNTPRGTRGTSFSIKGTNVKSELNINFKKTHSDEFANLFKKVDGKLVFVDNVKVDKNGAAIGLDASEKGEYVVMLGEFSDRPGDMDNDGVLNAKDALAALKNSVGIEAGKNPLVGDINGDGYINAKDALIILKKSVGMA